LKLDFVNYCLLDFCSVHLCHSPRRFILHRGTWEFLLSAGYCILKMGVLHWVMSEVETFTLMDRVAHPFAEIGIAQSPDFLAVLFNHKFL
jgi:hypothetical protein